MTTNKTDKARIAQLIPAQRRLLNDLAFSATYRGTAATEDALRFCLAQKLVETLNYSPIGRPLVKLTALGARIQRKARA